MAKGNKKTINKAGRVKTRSISENGKLLFTITKADRAPLAWLEAQLTAEAKLTDVCELPNADIIRYCIVSTYNRLSGGKAHYKK